MEDALGCYLDSLRAVRELPARLALPGHRRPGALAPRVDALLEHHARRLDELTAILRARPGSTAYEAAAHMTWNIRSRSWDDFPLAQKWFAVGECIFRKKSNPNTYRYRILNIIIIYEKEL